MSVAQSPSSSSTYVYCIVRGDSFHDGAYAFQGEGIGRRGDPVYTVHFMDVAAVVSNSSAARYDIGRENTMAHQLIIEEAMGRSDVLPVRFGTVARSPQEVHEKLLKRKFGEFHHLLEYVRGKAELGLKVFWNREQLFTEIAVEDDRIRRLRDAIAGKPIEETHYQRIQLGQLTEEAIIRRRDKESELIINPLRPLAVETRVNKILTDMMVLNASFLVDKSHEQEFDAAINIMCEAQGGRQIFKYAGPLPPYNFVNIVVNWGE